MLIVSLFFPIAVFSNTDRLFSAKNISTGLQGFLQVLKCEHLLQTSAFIYRILVKVRAIVYDLKIASALEDTEFYPI